MSKSVVYKVWVRLEIERIVTVTGAKGGESVDYETLWKSEPISSNEMSSRIATVRKFNEVFHGLGDFTTYQSDLLTLAKLRKAER